MSAEFKFPYGESELIARVPTANLSCVLMAKNLPGVTDDSEAIKQAICHPIGSLPLGECMHERDKVVVIVTDNTRACPDHILLPIILAELEKKLARRQISIIVALGTHAPLNKAELIKKLGRNIVESYQVFNHDAADTTIIGVTSRGIPVEINNRVLEADFRISTGFIEPHFFAGFSGGRKSIAPGVSSAASIIHNHSYQMLNNPQAKAGVLAGNPVHEDLVEQAMMAKLNFIVNVLLNSNQEITHVVAGHPVLAHEQGCAIEKDVSQVFLKRKVDISITSNSGAPLDLDFYQTCKGIDTAAQITRDGGVIIIASCCNTGVGPTAFKMLHESASCPADVLKTIQVSEPQSIWWQNQFLARAQLNHTIYLVSSLEDRAAEKMMVTPIKSIEEGLSKAFRLLGEHATVGIIPEGPMVIPVMED
jgi:nickel-dependent lactate racemase